MVRASATGHLLAVNEDHVGRLHAGGVGGVDRRQALLALLVPAHRVGRRAVLEVRAGRVTNHALRRGEQVGERLELQRACRPARTPAALATT